MRKTDRDRDGVLRPDQIETFLEKFNIPLQGVLDHLQRRFDDTEKFEGMTNYENLVRYFNGIKAKTEQTKPHPTVEKEPPTDKNSTKNRQKQVKKSKMEVEVDKFGKPLFQPGTNSSDGSTNLFPQFCPRFFSQF